MKNSVRSHVVLALAIALTGAMAFAEDGSALYKAKCQSCHGSAGTPSAGMAKMMGIKPISDPEIKKLSAEQMGAAVKNGKGKMKPVAGLSDAQVKEVVAFYRGLK
jgi:mono/diheme cytochrome c family protein